MKSYLELLFIKYNTMLPDSSDVWDLEASSTYVLELLNQGYVFMQNEVYIMISQQTFTSSKATIETLEGVKNVQR